MFKLLISGGLLFTFIVGYGAFCDFFFTQKKYLDLTEKKQWVLSLKGGEYDYAVLGSSRAFGAFDMNLLDSLTGWDGVNLGSNGSGFKDNYLILNQFLKSNSTNRLFLQVDMASLNSDLAFSNEFHAFTFFPYWDDQIVQVVLKEEIPILDNLFTEYVPQWRYFYFNKYFSPKEVLRKYQESNQRFDIYTNSNGGLEKNQSDNLGTELKISELPKSINQNDWKYLERTILIAQQEGIEVVLFTAPRYQDNQEGLKEILKDLPFLKVFPDDFPIKNREYFKDEGHLSRLGTKYFTLVFSNEI